MEKGGGVGGFHHLSGVHHPDAPGPAGHHAQIVGDEDHGHAQLVLQRSQKVEDLLLHGHIQRGGGLVCDQQLGIAGQGNGDGDPLAHPPGQLVGVLLEPLRGSGMPTCTMSSMARSMASFLDAWRW